LREGRLQNSQAASWLPGEPAQLVSSAGHGGYQTVRAADWKLQMSALPIGGGKIDWKRL
jgi:hypothetical protein